MSKKTTETLLDVLDPLFREGVEDIIALEAKAAARLGYKPSRSTLSTYRALFRRFGNTWREEIRGMNRQWCLDNRDKHSMSSRNWAKANPARAILGQAQQRATRRGFACPLCEDEVAKMLEGMRCSVTGLPLTWDKDEDVTKNPWAPSLDRIDRLQGYVPGNVRVTCWLFNHMRGEYTDEHVMMVARALVGASV